MYVIDFDNEIKADINHVIKKNYSTQSLLLSWESIKSSSPNFPETLSAVNIDLPRILTCHPYKVIKAGFTVVSPSMLGAVFLYLFEAYSIGDADSVFYTRLFSFYYSDQVAMLLAIKDIHLFDYLKKRLSWIDISTSNIVNTEYSMADYMWYPKGIVTQV